MIIPNNIYNGDCLELIKQVENEMVDLIITSPPYNVDLGKNKYNKNGYSTYKDSLEHSQYINWLKDIFTICYQKLKTGGRVCINIGDGKNGKVTTSSDIIQFMTKEIGYIPITHIIWNKNTTSARTCWGSWLSPQAPSYPTPFEHILVFAKENGSLQHKGLTDLTKDEFIKYAYALWEFAPEKKSFHPAPFPRELAYRLIKMNSYIDDVVLDIFSGSGTTCYVAKELKRKYIGFEIDSEYYEKSKERLKEINE